MESSSAAGMKRRDSLLWREGEEGQYDAIRVPLVLNESTDTSSSDVAPVRASAQEQAGAGNRDMTSRNTATVIGYHHLPMAARSSTVPINGPRTSTTPNERKMCFAFIKVLLKYLEKTQDDSLRQKAKAVIIECTIRNRNGDSNYLCLQGALERRLQQSLGPRHWSRAQVCFQRFLDRCRLPTQIEVTSLACV